MIQVQVTPQDIVNAGGNLKAFDEAMAKVRAEYHDAVTHRGVKCVQITMAEVDVSDWPESIGGDKKETPKKKPTKKRQSRSDEVLGQ